MAKFSMKRGGKEVGPAEVYAQPHSMSGKGINTRTAEREAESVGKDPNKMTFTEMRPGKPTFRVSAGDPAADDVKTSGIEVRGGKAQTKGRMARGKMG
jgi:hypothetical protein